MTRIQKIITLEIIKENIEALISHKTSQSLDDGMWENQLREIRQALFEIQD